MIPQPEITTINILYFPVVYFIYVLDVLKIGKKKKKPHMKVGLSFDNCYFWVVDYGGFMHS